MAAIIGRIHDYRITAVAFDVRVRAGVKTISLGQFCP